MNRFRVMVSVLIVTVFVTVIYLPALGLNWWLQRRRRKDDR